MTATAGPVVGVPWTSRLGAFLAIGTAPGALVLGAGLTVRNGGALPILALLLGAPVMAGMLYAQGLLGVLPPAGEGKTLAEASEGYLGPRTQPLLQALLGFTMVGWFGFNVGVGGAGLAAVLGVPGPVGPVLLAAPIVWVAARGRRGWNGLAVVTTTASLALVALVVATTATGAFRTVPVGGSPVGLLGDVGTIIGYIAVFTLRAPDFSHGLATRRDLATCVALQVGSTLLVAVAGASLAQATGTVDVVAALSDGAAAAIGNTLLAVAVVAATFTTLHSGSLAIRAVVPVSAQVATLLVAVPGTILAAVRFDRYLVSWLELLAVLLPPLMVPLIVEARRRRRGRDPRPVLAAMWLPGAAAGGLAAVVGGALAPLAAALGLLVAALATAAVHRRLATRRPVVSGSGRASS